MSIEALVEISRFYGSNPDYVIAGGGNTSLKDSETLYIKSSGRALADAVPDTFVRMGRKALAGIWEKTYPGNEVLREKEVLSDLMAARQAGEEPAAEARMGRGSPPAQKRPSVETLLHNLLPFAYVVHLHPALVNGMTCSQQGEKAMTEIFGETAIWIPSTKPGYVLSKKVKTALDNYRADYKKVPEIIFLQNHGVFVGADSVDGIKKNYSDIMERLEKKIKRQPDFSCEPIRPGENTEASLVVSQAVINATKSALAEVAEANAVFLCNREIAAMVRDQASFYPVSSAFTPDHIVYAGSDPLFTAARKADSLREDWKNHIDKTGRPPKIAAIQGLGVFGLGSSEKNAELALDLFKDTVKVAVFSESFGGPIFMSRDLIDFINEWEAEQFRKTVSAK